MCIVLCCHFNVYMAEAENSVYWAVLSLQCVHGRGRKQCVLGCALTSMCTWQRQKTVCIGLCSHFNVYMAEAEDSVYCAVLSLQCVHGRGRKQCVLGCALTSVCKRQGQGTVYF